MPRSKGGSKPKTSDAPEEAPAAVEPAQPGRPSQVLPDAIQSRINALQEQKQKQREENFSTPAWVEKHFNSNKEALLGQLPTDIDEAVTKQFAEFYKTAHDLGMFLSKKLKGTSIENTFLHDKIGKYQDLCKRLGEERKLMRKKYDEMEIRDKKWRADLEGQFDTSITEIKEQINKQEGANKNMQAQNEALNKQVEILTKQNKLLTEALDMREKDRNQLEKNFTEMLKTAMSERDALKKHLVDSLDINKEYSTRLTTYKTSYDELSETIKKSNEIIDILKKSKDQILKTNSILTKRNDEYLKKAKMWKTKVEKVMAEQERTEKQKKAMANLCRSLKEQLRDARGELELEKSNHEKLKSKLSPDPKVGDGSAPAEEAEVVKPGGDEAKKDDLTPPAGGESVEA